MAKKRAALLIEQGKAALKAGNKKEAERLLRQAVIEDTTDEFAWLWLSGAVKGVQRQRDCLNRAGRRSVGRSNQPPFRSTVDRPSRPADCAGALA